jgi:hypothetical protein
MVASAQAGANIQVDIGRANWSAFPQLQRAERPLNLALMSETLETILRERQCAIAGQTHRRFDVDVPYLVQVRPDGSAARVLVADIGCRPLENYVGSLVTALALEGNFRPTGGAGPRWYASSFNFNLYPG